VFVTKIEADYHFEEQQKLIVEVYDADNQNINNLKSQEFIGSLEFSPSSVVSQRNQTLKKPLGN